jgi:DNA-binding transcriptional ArsR family regulator
VRTTSSRHVLIVKPVLNYQSHHVEPPAEPLFHALADATRRQMIDRLIDGPASVSELAAPLPMSLPAVLQHLQVLEAGGLVRSHKAGRVRTCSIEPAALGAAERWIAQRRRTWEERLDRLGEFLAASSPPDEPSERSEQ